MKQDSKVKMKKVYSVCGIELSENHPPNQAMVGLIWFVVIISFPIWIWFFIGYKIFFHFGKLLNNVKEEEVVDEPEENRYY